ncbi:hypothetical protein DFH08DRAFT_1035564 [Mycena albidolilacea]|uniref:Uncharacterized protein n=1 Tax=Mycena albidolilacea TaxID=1033008 RepID=A0AAD7EF07_9AGAR|nr:hypothetical protein DFH08DRAFT_1035564 [Mycena albidolilacea]
MAFYLDPLTQSLRIEVQTRFNAGFLAVLPHITLLTLHIGNPLTLCVPLIDIISRCHVLQELYIVGTSAVAPPPPSVTPPPGLHRLTFSGLATSPAILRWLNAAGHLPNVDLITLPVVQSGEAPYISAALQKCFRHSHSRAVNSWNVYDLSLRPHPRTLSIRYSSLWIAELEVLFHVRLLALITKLVAGPALESLSIYFRATVSTFDWGALDAFLSSARFPRLREVVIECNPREVQFLLGRMLRYRTIFPSIPAFSFTGLDAEEQEESGSEPPSRAQGDKSLFPASTGELKHKELEEDAKADPFADPEKKTEAAESTPAADTTQARTPPGDKTAREPRPMCRSNIINLSTYYSTLVQRNNFLEYHPVLSEVSRR